MNPRAVHSATGPCRHGWVKQQETQAPPQAPACALEALTPTPRSRDRRVVGGCYDDTRLSCHATPTEPSPRVDPCSASHIQSVSSIHLSSPLDASDSLSPRIPILRPLVSQPRFSWVRWRSLVGKATLRRWQGKCFLPSFSTLCSSRRAAVSSRPKKQQVFQQIRQQVTSLRVSDLSRFSTRQVSPTHVYLTTAHTLSVFHLDYSNDLTRPTRPTILLYSRL
ncbi:hypothetical protein LXA43DRAFT_354734 [Ganoderma leucocontextum]|nr:hypothetical protein LXA43DRAFT_354734 [Ganoderma leucocontextum]